MSALPPKKKISKGALIGIIAGVLALIIAAVVVVAVLVHNGVLGYFYYDDSYEDSYDYSNDDSQNYSGDNLDGIDTENSSIIGFGYCGENATYTIYYDYTFATYTVAIEGSGEMWSIEDFYDERETDIFPWFPFRRDIKTVYIGSEITFIPEVAFYGVSDADIYVYNEFCDIDYEAEYEDDQGRFIYETEVVLGSQGCRIYGYSGSSAENYVNEMNEWHYGEDDYEQFTFISLD